MLCGYGSLKFGEASETLGYFRMAGYKILKKFKKS
jgi:hypothetical protein